MTYKVEITRPAQKQLTRIARDDRSRIYSAIQYLGITPRPAGCIKLTNRGAYRIRIGTYRVIYEIEDDRLLVLVIRIGHRRDVYE